MKKSNAQVQELDISQSVNLILIYTMRVFAQAAPGTQAEVAAAAIERLKSLPFAKAPQAAAKPKQLTA